MRKLILAACMSIGLSAFAGGGAYMDGVGSHAIDLSFNLKQPENASVDLDQLEAGNVYKLIIAGEIPLNFANCVELETISVKVSENQKEMTIETHDNYDPDTDLAISVALSDELDNSDYSDDDELLISTNIEVWAI